MRIILLAGAALSAALAAQRVSPRLDEVVFVCNREAADNICVINLATSNIRQITFEKEAGVLNRGPRWSPDRRRIAFFRRVAPRTDIYMMNSDGSAIQKVTGSDGTTLYRNPAWSPDGSRLAIECGSPNDWQICTVSVDGSSLRKLTHADAGGSSSESPDWSPDGKRIAFHSNRDVVPSGTPPFRGADIFVMDADGSNVRRLTLTPPGRFTQNPAWSRNGQSIAFTSDRDGASLYIMDTEGKEIQRLTKDDKPDGHPRWSPDDRQLVFHSTRDGVEGAASDVELYVIGVDGTGLRRVTNNRLYDGMADW